MTHEENRKNRRQKRKRWQQRGGRGMVRKTVPRRRSDAGASDDAGGESAPRRFGFARQGTRPDGQRRFRGTALGKLPPIGQMIMGLTMLAVVVGFVVMMVYGIFFL